MTERPRIQQGQLHKSAAVQAAAAPIVEEFATGIVSPAAAATEVDQSDLSPYARDALRASARLRGASTREAHAPASKSELDRIEDARDSHFDEYRRLSEEADRLRVDEEIADYQEQWSNEDQADLEAKLEAIDAETQQETPTVSAANPLVAEALAAMSPEQRAAFGAS